MILKHCSLNNKFKDGIVVDHMSLFNKYFIPVFNKNIYRVSQYSYTKVFVITISVYNIISAIILELSYVLKYIKYDYLL